MWLCMRRARYLRGRMELMGNKERTYCQGMAVRFWVYRGWEEMRVRRVYRN